MEQLRERGLGSLRARWTDQADIASYLRDPAAMAPVFRDQGLATPAFLLGLSNWVLAANVEMPAWLHLQTDSRFFRAVAPGSELVAEAAIADLFERKGHEFVDVDVAVFDAASDAAVASILLRAIYRLRSR